MRPYEPIRFPQQNGALIGYVADGYWYPDYADAFGPPRYAMEMELNSGTWTDVTSDVMRFNCARRLADIDNPLEPAQLTIEMDNKSRRWSPLNASSPYFGLLLPNKQVRASVEYLPAGYWGRFNLGAGGASAAPSSNFNVTTGFSISAWTNQNTVNGSTGTVVNYAPASNTANGFSLFAAAGKMTFRVVASGAAVNINATDPSTIVPGESTHFTGVYVGSQYAALYRDGTLVASASAAGYLYANVGSGPLFIGQNAAAANKYTGDLDEVTLFNRSLSPSEARNLSVNSIDYTGVVAAWRFNEGSGSAVSDASGFSQALTLTGSYAWANATNTWTEALGTTPTVSKLFTGRLSRLSVDPSPEQDTAVIEAESSAKQLERFVITTSLFANPNPASMYAEVMTRCAVNSFTSEALADTMPYFWLRDTQAEAAIASLLQFGQYSMYEDGGGTFNLKGRYFGLFQTAVNTLDNALGAYSINYSLDNRDIYNYAKIGATPRIVAASVGTVAWIPQAITIPASSAISFWVAYVDPRDPTVQAPATQMQTPVASTDYLVNASSDGSGADMTATTSVNATFFGQAAICSLYNGSGNTAYVTTFRLRGKSAQEQPSIQAEKNVSSSEVVYGRHGVAFTDQFIGNQSYLDDYATGLVSDKATPRPALSVALKNRFNPMLSMELGGTVSVVESRTGVNSQWSITSIEHDVALVSGVEHRVTFGLRYYAVRPWLVLDDSVKGVIDSNRALAF